jgi:hypothetical protein
MPYNINLTNGNLLSIVEDGTIDVSSTSVVLVGKNFPGYGEYLNENFVRLLENFSNGEAPEGALLGQLWYDSLNSELKIWKGSSWISTSRPTIVNDTTSSGAQFLTFVSASSGTPDLKVSASSGIVYTPSSGNLGLGVTGAASKLVINANTTTAVAAAAPLTDVVVHVHGATGKAPKTLLDSYGGTTGAGNYSIDNGSQLVLRRSNGTNLVPEAVKVNDVIGILSGQGFNGSAFSTGRAGVNFIATENWNLASNGTRVVIQATNNGSSTPSNVATFSGDGSLTVLGALRAGGDITAFHTSDMRLKTNVERIPDALNKVLTLDGVTFNWNHLATDKDTTAREPGVLAHQIKDVLPEAVTTRVDGFMAVRYEKLIPLLIEAIKDLKAEIDQLKQSST